MVALLALVAVGCDKKPEPQAAQPAEPEPRPAKAEKPKAADEQFNYSPAPATPSREVAKPIPAATESKSPSGAAGKYVVKKGDTLFSIARKELGSDHRVKDIKAANPGIDFDRLKVGQEINLPAK